MEKEFGQLNYRRQRSSTLVRDLVADVVLTHRKMILPLFVEEGLAIPREINGLPHVLVNNEHTIVQEVEEAIKKGISKFLLFIVPAKKADSHFSFSFAEQVIRLLKHEFGSSIWLSVDICLCSYTSHGHCGLLNQKDDDIDNAASVHALSQYALAVAAAGADCVAPSDMMDGRIGAIRKILQVNALDRVQIMSYSSKFASQFYGPFRDACHSAPQTQLIKDRKTYQLSPSNLKDAIACALRDEKEGADFLMVKPAAHYTDVITSVKSRTHLPIAAYHVSGEYCAIELMAEAGLLQRDKAHLEVWTNLVRAGANMIITYAAKSAQQWIAEYEF